MFRHACPRGLTLSRLPILKTVKHDSGKYQTEIPIQLKHYILVIQVSYDFTNLKCIYLTRDHFFG